MSIPIYSAIIEEIDGKFYYLSINNSLAEYFHRPSEFFRGKEVTNCKDVCSEKCDTTSDLLQLLSNLPENTPICIDTLLSVDSPIYTIGIKASSNTFTLISIEKSYFNSKEIDLLIKSIDKDTDFNLEDLEEKVNRIYTAMYLSNGNSIVSKLSVIDTKLNDLEEGIKTILSKTYLSDDDFNITYLLVKLGWKPFVVLIVAVVLLTTSLDKYVLNKIDNIFEATIEESIK